MFVDGHQVPQAISEVASEFPKLKLSATDRDFVLSGFMSYTFKGKQYNTPVQLFRSHRPLQGEECFRCRIDLDSAPNLMVSTKATYIERMSGVVRVSPPPQPSEPFISFAKRVQGVFSTTPPLIQKSPGNNAAAMITSSSTNRPFDAYLLDVVRDVSLFHDSALQFNHATHTVKGVIPIQYKDQRYTIPVEIKLNPETFAQQPPMAFVTPTPTMALVPHMHVQSGTGLIETPLVVRWRNGGAPVTMLELLKEMQQSFSNRPPVCAAPPGYASVSGRHTVTAAQPVQPEQREEASSPLTPHPVQQLSAAPTAPAPQTAPVQAPVAAPPQVPLQPPKPAVGGGGGGGNGGDADRSCVICLEAPPDCVFLPCRHMSVCKNCAPHFKTPAAKCPVCRGTIENVIEVFV